MFQFTWLSFSALPSNDDIDVKVAGDVNGSYCKVDQYVQIQISE